MTQNVMDWFKEGDVGVEVGVAYGENAQRLLTTNPKLLYLVDCWEEQDEVDYDDYMNKSTQAQEILYKKVCYTFFSHNNVKIIREYSVSASKSFDDESFDWVYIDANHGYEGVKEDIIAWYPKIKMNGYISGHDWLEPPLKYKVKFGVQKAVKELLGMPDHVNLHPHPSWIKQKRTSKL